MDINETFSRNKSKKKEEPKSQIVFDLKCQVEKVGEEDFKLNGEIKTDSDIVDNDLLSTILASTISRCVPLEKLEEVLMETFDKLKEMYKTSDHDDFPRKPKVSAQVIKLDSKDKLDAMIKFLESLGE